MLRRWFGRPRARGPAGWQCVAIASVAALAAACGTPDTSGAGGGAPVVFVPSGFTCSGAVVHYSTDVAPIFDAHCGGVEGCHIPMHTAVGAYNLIVGVPTDECADPRLQVAPGDPEHSYVINKMTNTNLCGESVPMPRAAVTWIELPPTLIQPVYDWICEGAKND